MTSKYVFDTYAWIEYFDGTEKGKQVDELLKTGAVITPSLVLAEISFKYESENPTELPRRLQFISLHSTVAGLTNEIAIDAGKLKSRIRKEAKNDIGLIDCLIYATALKHGAKTVTGDPHFKELSSTILL